MKNNHLPVFLEHSTAFLYCCLDKNFLLLKANTLFLQQFEISSIDYTGKPFDKDYGLLQHTEILEAISTCLKKAGTIVKIDLDTKISTGKEKRFRWEISSVNEGDNNDLLIQVIGTDITAHKKKEQELLFNTVLLENIEDAFIGLDKDFIITNWNKAAENIHGVTAAEVKGKKGLDFFKHEFVNDSLENSLSILEKTGHWTGEMIFTRPVDKKNIVLEASLTSIKNDAEIIGYVALARVAKEYFINEKFLFPEKKIARTTENSSTKIIEEIIDYAIFSLDKNGIIQNWNKGAESIKGYTAAEIVGKDFRNFYTPEDREKKLPDQLLQTATETGRVFHEGWRVRKDKSIFWAEVVITALRNEKGELTGFSKVTRDLTEKKIIETHLKSSEKSFQQLFASTTEGFIMLDKSCKILVINKTGKKIIEWISGRKVDVGDNALFFIPPSKQEALQFHVSKAYEGQRSEYETFYAVKDRKFWLLLNYTPVKDENKQITGVCLVTKDISERKMAEGELNKVQKLFTSFMANTPTMTWIIDENNIFRYLNTPYKNAFELDDSAVGKSIYEIFPKNICDSFVENNIKAWDSGTAIETIEEGVGPKGEKQVYQIFKFPLEADNGTKLLGGVALDITRNILNQEKLQRSYERYDYATQATSDAIWDWNIKKDVIYAGESFKTIFGYESHSDTMEARLNCIHPDDRGFIKKDLQKTITDTAQRWQAEYRFICSDNTYKIILDKAYIIRNEKNEAFRMIGAMQDVTEQRKLEKLLIKEESKKKREIIQAIISAQEKERRELAYELHDNVNQMLSSAKLMLEVVTDSKEVNIDFVKKSNEYLRNAINELRRISHNLSPGILKDISLEAAIQDIVEQINKTDKIHIIFKKRNYAKDKSVEAPEIQLSVLRIVQEQLNNILKHADATEVFLQLFTTKNKIVLIINDNGKGFSVSKTKRGLGLHNIFNRAEYYHGTVQLESSPGNGCTLKVEIPFVSEQISTV